jgi:predicted Zn-dependent peptidase
METMNHYFNDWQEPTSTKNIDEDLDTTKCIVTPPAQSGVYIVEKPDSVQTELRIGFPTVGIDHEDFAAIKFINTVFGEAFCSRLNTVIREEKGYTYGISSYMEARRFANTLVIATSVGNDITAVAMEAIMEEIQNIGAAPLKDDEIALMQKYIPGSFALRIESLRQVLGIVGMLTLCKLPLNFYEEYFRQVASLTKDSLFEKQQEYFAPKSITFSASGDSNELQNTFNQYGTIHLLDENGNPRI